MGGLRIPILPSCYGGGGGVVGPQSNFWNGPVGRGLTPRIWDWGGKEGVAGAVAVGGGGVGGLTVVAGGGMWLVGSGAIGGVGFSKVG